MLGIQITPRRLRRVRFANARRTRSWPRNRTKYLYDENGNRTSLTKRDRTTIIGFQYDTLNRVIVKDIPGGTANDVAFEYDEAGRPKWAKYVDDNGSGVVYSYGLAKRLTSEATFGRSVNFDYDIASNRTKVIWPDGNWVYSNFDNLNRVNKVCENGVAGCASGLLITYTLDPLSRRDAIARPNGASSDFDYDLASRLTLLTQNVSGTTNDLSRTFTYTLASQLQTRINATAAHAYSPAPANTGYAVNGRNQYTSVAGATFTHDLNGNLTGDGARTFGYDAENRLTSVSGSQSLTLSYDPLGRLRQTTAGATTDFLYDGDRLIAEYNGATVLDRYAHGPGVDEPIVWYEGATLTNKRWLYPDERGSIVAWTDASPTVTVYRYGAYGEPAGGDFSGSRFRFTGQIALPEVSLYHYKARIYDPSLGRFLQTDPVGYDDSFHLYVYVHNDPLNWSDPTGSYEMSIVEQLIYHLSEMPGPAYHRAVAYAPSVVGAFTVGFAGGLLINEACGGNCFPELGGAVYDLLHPETPDAPQATQSIQPPKPSQPATPSDSTNSPAPKEPTAAATSSVSTDSPAPKKPTAAATSSGSTNQPIPTRPTPSRCQVVTGSRIPVCI